MKKPATYRSKLSARASLPRAFSPVTDPANGGANGGVVQRSGVAIPFCTVTHNARLQTLHHLNSALVGEYPKKIKFCRDYVEFLAGHCSPFCSRRFALLSSLFSLRSTLFVFALCDLCVLAVSLSSLFPLPTATVFSLATRPIRS